MATNNILTGLLKISFVSYTVFPKESHPNHPYQKVTLELVYNLRENLRINQQLDEDDRELVMRLEPLYQRAVQSGEQRLVIRLLNRRIGEIDASLIEQVQGLSIEQLENLGEALLDFSEVGDLEVWLNQQQR